MAIRVPFRGASMAVEALENLMARSLPNWEAVRQAGGVLVLVRLLDSGPGKDISEHTVAAFIELVNSYRENQTLVWQQWLHHSLACTTIFHSN